MNVTRLTKLLIGLTALISALAGFAAATATFLNSISTVPGAWCGSVGFMCPRPVTGPSEGLVVKDAPSGCTVPPNVRKVCVVASPFHWLQIGSIHFVVDENPNKFFRGEI